MNLNIAWCIKQEVRDFYGSGLKSRNKAYFAGADPTKVVHPDDIFDDKFQQWSTTMMAVKATKRNVNSQLSPMYLPEQASGQSDYDFGRRIYNGGRRSAFSSGNCSEMAVVSAVIAVDNYFVNPNMLYIVTVNSPADHVFCLFSEEHPTANENWTTPSAMIPGNVSHAAYVIDPWLNTACAADEYWVSVQARLAKWAQDNKRICWKGRQGNRLGWYLADGSYAAAFAKSKLEFAEL